MPRPRIKRCIAKDPIARFYKPQSVPMKDLKVLVLSHDQLEALRLADMESFDQESAAFSMNISRPTFSRLVNEARKIVASALVEGCALKIEGGNFNVSNLNLID